MTESNENLETKAEMRLPPSLDFVYSVDRELERVKDTVRRKDFFIEHGYNVSLPDGITLENFEDFTEEDVRKKVTEEFDLEKSQEIIDEINNGWTAFGKELTAFFETLPGDLPDSLEIVFTQYGSGGSYWPPSRVIINIGQQNPRFQTFIHEVIHLLIEKEIVQKHKLSQPEKESIVDWIMINSAAVKSACNKERFQKFGPPSEELLKKVGLKIE